MASPFYPGTQNMRQGEISGGISGCKSMAFFNNLPTRQVAPLRHKLRPPSSTHRNFLVTRTTLFSTNPALPSNVRRHSFWKLRLEDFASSVSSSIISLYFQVQFFTWHVWLIQRTQEPAVIANLFASTPSTMVQPNGSNLTPH